ncbi:uncharacterized protein LOC143376094 [Andrena cerasifolii]|uniref:uncharacterized protein LOC143376094 n=1 Tax=Andrena cerasifolii TaxID=2819439 RepID=UPI0040378A4F
MMRNAHFKDKAMPKGPKQNSNLKAVVATTLPFKQIILPSNCAQANSNTHQMVNSTTTEKAARERNNLLNMQPPTVIRASAYQSINNSRIIKIIPVTRSQLNKLIVAPTTCKTAHSKSSVAIPKIVGTSARTIKKVSNANAIKKVPVLKITINKKYNKPPASNLKMNKRALDAASNIGIHERKKGDEGVNPDVRDRARDIDAIREPIIVDLVATKTKNATVGMNSAYTSKIAYARKGDLSRDNSRQTSAEKVRYLYTKAQRDCDILRIRLRALKERQKQEKLEVRKLQAHLGELSKDVAKEPVNEKPEEYSARKRTPLLLGDTEEDECEKLLRKVRRIQRDILNPNYSATASDKRLERTSTKTKITRVYGRRKTSDGSEVIVLKREIVNKVRNSADVLEDFKSEDYVEPAVET